MLVLSRKSGEEVYIGDNIRLVVNRISGNRVTIAIAAPDDVHIVRGELSPMSLPIENTGTKEDLQAAM